MASLFMVSSLTVVRMSLFPKLIYRFSVTPVQCQQFLKFIQ